MSCCEEIIKNCDYKGMGKEFSDVGSNRISKNSRPCTPTLDRMLEIREQTRICGEFLDWLQGKYAMFDKKIAREEPFYRGGGDYINTEKLLAEFFGIDLEEADKEKEELLRFM